MYGCLTLCQLCDELTTCSGSTRPSPNVIWARLQHLHNPVYGLSSREWMDGLSLGWSEEDKIQRPAVVVFSPEMELPLESKALSLVPLSSWSVPLCRHHSKQLYFHYDGMVLIVSVPVLSMSCGPSYCTYTYIFSGTYHAEIIVFYYIPRDIELFS